MSELLDFDAALDRLEELGCRPQLSRDDHAYSLCPSHADRKPSLSIGVGHTQGLVATCFAGCTFTEILGALNGIPGGVHQTDRERLAKVKARPRYRFHATDNYTYIATDGTPLLKQRGVFIDPETGEVVDPKSFKWWHLVGGNWVDGRGGHVPLLYDPQDSIGRARATGSAIYVVEGEKDCHAVLAAGAFAVSPHDGAYSHWLSNHTEQLAGLAVAVIADDDGIGRAHALKVAQAVGGQVLLPAAGKDASDHLAAGLGLDALQPLDGDGSSSSSSSSSSSTSTSRQDGSVPDSSPGKASSPRKTRRDKRADAEFRYGRDEDGLIVDEDLVFDKAGRQVRVLKPRFDPHGDNHHAATDDDATQDDAGSYVVTEKLLNISGEDTLWTFALLLILVSV